mmetsp:Transcript_7485/g.23801  ORF Transcript_7485/g.23801 Transcript_7485/m.23801 type:complete len:226 (-) Transcript_7485:222-899(-)
MGAEDLLRLVRHLASLPAVLVRLAVPGRLAAAGCHAGRPRRHPQRRGIRCGPAGKHRPRRQNQCGGWPRGLASLAAVLVGLAVPSGFAATCQANGRCRGGRSNAGGDCPLEGAACRPCDLALSAAVLVRHPIPSRLPTTWRRAERPRGRRCTCAPHRGHGRCCGRHARTPGSRIPARLATEGPGLAVPRRLAAPGREAYGSGRRRGSHRTHRQRRGRRRGRHRRR